MRQLLLAGIIILLSKTSFAQSGTVSGKITDSSGKPLPLTTVTIFRARDTTIITYRLASEQGEFRIPGLPLDIPLRLLATYGGYEGYRKEFTLTGSQNVFDAGRIKMINTTKELDEVIVVAERPPVVVKKDTIEFNATAFKTLPNALVEDLMKKLPGMQVDADGNMLFNGRKVNRITVDGKKFFGDDPKAATRNLPSNFIEKVQVTDDQEEVALKNDGDMSNIGKVVNLTLKKNVKKGWFGKAFGGLGTDERYEAGGMMNTFRDTLQLSLIAISNNVNRTGFTMSDITTIGGFDRSGVNSISVSSTGGFSINGISFASTAGGIATTSGAGFNLNHAPSKKLSFFGSYFYGFTKNVLERDNNTQQFIADTNINSRTISTTNGRNISHNLSAGGNWKPDSLTNINFRTGYEYSNYNSSMPSSLLVINNFQGPLSKGSGTLYNHSSYGNFSFSGSLTRRGRKKKTRNFSASLSANIRSNPADITTESLNEYYYPFSYSRPFYQMRSTESPSTYINANGQYSDPLSSKLTLRLGFRAQYDRQEQDIYTYEKAAGSGKYDSVNYLMSNNLLRNQLTLAGSAGLAYRIKQVLVTGTAILQQYWINNRFGISSYQHLDQQYTYLLPSLNVNWKSHNFSLSQSVGIPWITNLTPVPDNSNPFNIVYGNPYLLPSKSTSLSVNGNWAKTKSNSNLSYNLGFYVGDNATAQSVTVKSDGVRTTMPVNVNGISAVNGYIRFSKQFKTQRKFQLSLDPTLSLSKENGVIIFNGVKSGMQYLNLRPQMGIAMNWNDVVEFTPRYTPSFIYSRYDNDQFASADVITQNLSTDLIIRVPKKMVWESYLTYRYNSQVAPGLPKENVYWNAAVSVLFLKQDRGQLKLSAYDLLNRYNSYFRYVSGNSIIDNRSSVLQRYFMLSFIYNVRLAGSAKQKVGGRQSLFFF